MSPNIEKFGPKSMRDLDLKEGIDEYEKEKEEGSSLENEKIIREANEIIETYYGEAEDRVENFQKRLNRSPKGLKNAIFSRWLESDPEACVSNIDLFSPLPSSFQFEVVKFLNSRDRNYYWPVERVLKSFKQVTNRNLHSLILENSYTGVSLLVENKSRMPYLTEKDILEKARHDGDKSNDWIDGFDFAAVVLFLDQLPSLNREKVLRGVVRQRINNRSKLLFENKEKLNLSDQDLIDLFFECDRVAELCGNLNGIDPKYHQEIAERALGKKKDFEAVASNASHFKRVNIPEIIERVFASRIDKKKDVLAVIGRNLAAIGPAWGKEMSQELVEALVSEYPSEMALAVGNFGGKIDKSELIEKLFEQKRFLTLIQNSEKLGLVLDESLAKRIVLQRGVRTLVPELSKFETMTRETFLLIMNTVPDASPFSLLKFSGLNKEDVYRALKKLKLSTSQALEIVAHWGSFPNLRLDDELAEVLINNRHGLVVAERLKSFQNLDHEKIALELIGKGDGKFLMLYFDSFEGLDHSKIVDAFIKYRDVLVLLHNIDEFHDFDENEVVLRILELSFPAEVMAGYLPHFHQLSFEVASKFCELGQVLNVARNFNSFQGLEKDRAFGTFLIESALNANDLNLGLEVNAEYTPFLDKTLIRLGELCGEYFTVGLYRTLKDVEAGSLPEDARVLGVRRTGETGLNELRNILRDKRHEFLGGQIDVSALQENKLLRDWFKSIVRLSQAEWHGTVSFDEIVAYYQEHQNELRPLPEEYFESEEVKVTKRKQKLEGYRPSEGFRNRYQALLDSIKAAYRLSLIPEGRGLNELQKKLREVKAETIGNLQAEKEEQENPKAKENLEKSIKGLQVLNLEEIGSPQEIFNVLSKHKEFEELLRQTMFYFSFYLNPNIGGTKFNEFNPDDPQSDDLSFALNFIDHITNQETLKKYFTDQKAAKNFKNLLNVKALEEELQRMGKYHKDSTETMSMKFSPRRDLLTEFSGQIGDACWAGKEKSILEAHPNFISLIMTQNPNTINERVAGSCFLIETQSQNNEPLLVIRGLNPLENVINQLNFEDFFQKLINYLKPIAENQGRKLAVVVDDHYGGSGTNRQTFYKQFFGSLRQKLEPVRLKSKKDTDFNDYDITGETYLV